MSRRQRNRYAIELYITNYDRLFPASMGFINVEEMTGKPESRPPIPDSDHVWKYLEDEQNRRTSFYLAPVFSKLAKEHPPLYLIAGLVGGWIKPLQNEEADHAALRRWQAGETQQDKDRADLFNRALNKLEEDLNDQHPTVEIEVNVPRNDDPVGSVREDYDRKVRWEKEDSFRQIASEIERIVQKEQCTVQAAIGLYRDRLEQAKKPDVSPRKIMEARAFVKWENSQAVS